MTTWTSEEFRGWLERVGLTRKEAAAALGVSEGTVDLYCRGRRYDRGGTPVEVPAPVVASCKRLKAAAGPPLPSWMREARALVAGGQSRFQASQILGVPKSVFYREWERHNRPS